MLGVSPARLRSWLRAGVVAAARGEDGEVRFSFQDLVLLRKAEGLRMHRIAPQRVHSALRSLRQRLPSDRPLSGLNIAAEGKQIVVDDGEVRWQPDSGQVLFDFARRPAREGRAPEGAGATVTALASVRATIAKAGGAPATAGAPPAVANRPANDDGAALSAQEVYERACALEESAPKEAMDLYRRVLAEDPRCADAHVNLGRLLHEAGEVHAALVHYRAALDGRPGDATASFNIGVALEDLGSVDEAIEAYTRAVERDASNADAHYNVARLLEQTGKPELAIRHLLIYRQLTRRK